MAATSLNVRPRPKSAPLRPKQATPAPQAAATIVTPMNTWVPTVGCSPDQQTIVFSKSGDLWYAAAQGQTNFPLATPDHFNNTYFLISDNIEVYANGSRLAPDDGAGFGGYTVDIVNNAVNLVWPAGAGEIVAISVFDNPYSPAPSSLKIKPQAGLA